MVEFVRDFDFLREGGRRKKSGDDVDMEGFLYLLDF